MLLVDEPLARRHYAEHVEKPFFVSLLKFITSSPIVAMVLEGPDAVTVSRNMMGPTSGVNAPAGTIRGDFAVSKQCNIVHGSDSLESAKREISLYFNESDIISYTIATETWLGE
jgi:nucleoside-diphosphate kinase